MKLRNGFVSNSSTTSFMIYGYYGDLQDLRKKFLDKFSVEDVRAFFADHKWYDGESMLADDGEHAEMFAFLLEDKAGVGFSAYNPSWSWDEVYLGSKPWTCKDDETLGDWKGKVQSAFDYLFGEGVPLGFIEEGWRDG